MENGARMILQKLPEENRQVSHSQAQPAAAKNPARVPPLPSLPQRSCAFRAAYACSPLEGLEVWQYMIIYCQHQFYILFGFSILM